MTRQVAINIGVFVVAILIATTAGASGLSPAVPASACTKVASPTGSDSSAGSASAPYKTVGKLVASLHGGETGCLHGGSYSGDVTIATAHITLTSYAGEQATVVGRLWVKKGADGVLVSGLHLDGKNAALLPSPTVNANDVQFVGDDVTNDHTEICFIIGSSSFGRAVGTVIRGNRIHDCGKLPSQNQDHGIYVSDADNTQIIDNVIYRNVDRGIQLYPNAQGTVIRGNIIDSNGEGIIFSGQGGTASSHTVVQHNTITSSKIRHDVESFWPSGNPIGTGNVVSLNCIHGGAEGEIGGQTGFTASSNTIATPGYANAAAGDYRIGKSSPCASVLAASQAPAGLKGEPPTTNVSPPPPTTTTPPPTTTTPPPPPPWTPVVHGRVRITKAGASDLGKLGEVTYISNDGKRVLLLMDSDTVRPALVTDIGP